MPKSTCCGAKIIRFSGRRRQCIACRCTWRIRVKKRGRPALRSDPRLIRRVLIQKRSLTEIAQRRKITRQALGHRFLKALTTAAAKRKPTQPASGELILLVDGLWFKFKRRPWVLYLMALRPIEEDTATFIAPLLLEGSERMQGWQAALATIPTARRVQIRALVGDKFPGCATIARQNGWVLQLCHFHLVAQLAARLGRRRPSLQARIIRQETYRLVRAGLETADWPKLKEILGSLKTLIAERVTPISYKRVVRGFIRRYTDYHAYLTYPQLRLPKTNNTSEAMGRRVRDLLSRTRSLSSPKSLSIWAAEQIRLHPRIACKSASLPTN